MPYDLYLRGWGFYKLYQKDENEKAIDLFKQAIDADPKFALAYTGLADAYIERVQRFHSDDIWSDSAVDLCQQAVALDPKEVRKPYRACAKGRNPATLVMSEAIALHGLGREAEARRTLEDYCKRSHNQRSIRFSA